MMKHCLAGVWLGGMKCLKSIGFVSVLPQGKQKITEEHEETEFQGIWMNLRFVAFKVGRSDFLSTSAPSR